MKETVVATHKLTKRFGEARAVDEVSLTVKQGDIYGFLGLNGAGKTTTLRMLLGLLRPTSGTLELFGERSRSGCRAARARIGAMVEGPAFFGALSGAANLKLIGSLTAPVQASRVKSILATVGLEEAGRKPVRAYSLGMKQRLGIAMALVSSPEMVILDEPTNGLDPNGIREMRALIRQMNEEEGVTFIISSHLLHEIEMVCNKVAILEHGQLVVEDTIEKLIGGNHTYILRATPEDVAARVAGELTSKPPQQGPDGLVLDIDPDRLPELVRRLTGADVDVLTIQEKRGTLEDFFLHSSRVTQGGGLS